MLDRIFRDNSISVSEKINLVLELHKNPNCADFMIHQALKKQKPATDSNEAGFYGNVWIRKLYFKDTGVVHDGHSHNHDHMSILVKGSVVVEIEGYKPQTYHAPTFITIKANDHHKIVALEDDTIWFCVFAMRDTDGLSAEEYYGDANNPRLNLNEQF
jgi:hypothetical protein